jgi:hypothetical protein
MLAAPQSTAFVQIVENKNAEKPTQHWFRRSTVASITLHGDSGLIVRVGTDVIGLNFADSATQLKALALLIYEPTP